MTVPTPSPSTTAVQAAAEHHDLFNWWSSIWLPAIGSFLTLVLSGVSLYVAWQALRISQRVADLEETKLAKEERAKRATLAHDLKRWHFETIWLQVNEPSAAVKKLTTDHASAVARDIAALGDKTAEQLRSWLLRHSKIKTDDDIGKQAVEGWDVIDEWVKDPSSIDGKAKRDALISAIENRLDDRTK